MTAAVGPDGSAFDAVADLLSLESVPADRPTPDGTIRLGLVSGRSGPRFLVPTDHPAAAARSCLAYLGLRDLRTRATRGAVGLAFAARLGGAVARTSFVADAGPGSLLDALAGLLPPEPDGESGLAVAVGIGQRDEVWKPTLQVFRPDGTPAAFVKVGLGPVAHELVTTEAATLRAWGEAPDPRLVVPPLLADATWRGIRLAAVGPLPLDARRLPPGPIGAWAVRDLDGPFRWQEPTEADWWTTRRTANADHAAVDALLDRIEARWTSAAADLGPDERASAWARWHGDWVPWNLARCHRGLIAWDWEYSEPDAPVGLDEVHGAYQQARVAEGRSVADSLAIARAAAVALIRRGTSPASASDLRHAAGRTAPRPTTGPGTWLADAHVAMLVTRSAALERSLGRPPADQRELLAAAADAVGRSS